ncbi:SET domain-containing protein SmydA-8, isoform A [Eumeta japonica]|uniref:SET domain-containing protein SmydA-8, isoform A n=1 Tax=Eumeta variegata TaxID=151549 RepID=A0A4C1UNA5_EUMVA|nr:SET domain-containing protein SmydA-8, isoform A [Eumeta japonica]
MSEEGLCIVCAVKAKQKCASCQTVYYCSRDHQKQHWKIHKHQCTPARIRQDEKVGRYLEATRDIKVGDVILKEKALITGPAQVTPPVCLGCYRLLNEGQVFCCDKCGWPFCNENCSTNDIHLPECRYTQARGEKVSISTYGVPHPNYQCITVLRCLYQRDNDPKLWEKLQSLESHCKDRKGTDKWLSDKKMISDIIMNFFKLSDKFTEEEIMKCCGIVQINGHEVPLVEPEYVAVFERVSMMEHSCKANCNKSFTSNGEILLCAGTSIPSGDHLSVCYTDPLWGTEGRRHHLAESKFFECSCSRCADKTEFGTMYSAVKCRKKNCKGYLLPETFLVPILHKTKSPDPNKKNLDDKFWKCNACDDSISDAIIQQLLQDIGKELSAMPKEDADACERFIQHCCGYLHPSHYYITDVAIALSQMIGQESELGLTSVSDDRLALKTQLCKKLADLFEILAPAESRLRGSLLFELHAAVAETGRRKSLTDGPAVMLGYVTESRGILSQSAQLLRNEPPELPEGRLARQAAENLRQMDKLILTLSATLPSPL